MIPRSDIERVGSDIGKAARAEKVVLFGSYAKGNPSPDSDVDFLVVAEGDQPRHKRSRELYRCVQPYRFPMDILVYTPQEMDRALRTPSSFVSCVMREGKIIYVRRD